MNCAKCGADNREGRKFCAKCGAALARSCPRCGASNEPGDDFCGDCGGAFGAPSASSAAKVPDAAPIRVTETPAAENLEGERKTVTALFADIKGSTELEQDLDPEEARAIVDPALKLMIDAVRRYDGYIVQSTGDGIFALFGAPVAHEDHPQRALYAALRMQEELRRYSAKLVADGGNPLQCRVGVNTGEVVVRSISTGGKNEYTPIGHTTNLASRMQAVAPVGSTAVAEPTRKLCEGYFALNPLGPTKVKGVSEPVNVYEVTGLGPLRTRLQRSAGRGLSKFVGRDREMEAMKTAAERATSGRGQIVAAMAEAGAGKSRLIYEFKVKNQPGWMVLETFSVSHGKASAFLPVLDLLYGYFKISGEDDARARREKIGGKVLMLDRSLEDTLPYLFALLGIVEGDDPLAQMDAQVRKRRTLDSIKRILLRESLNQSLMVIFEDLHWIDDETQALLNLLADSIANAKILLLVNYRPEYSHSWGSKTYYTQLPLDPLGKESADEMLSALVGDGADLAQLKRVIIERTEGNPFFMEETVQVLLDEGALVRNGATRLTKPISELKIPPTVQGILAARIDRLPADAKDLLQTLAVIGRQLPMSLIRAVAQNSDDELEGMLNDLQLSEFIYEQPAVGDTEYVFKHALTQEVSYNSVLNERRKLLHERIGESIESLYKESIDDHLLDLAHHYSRSADVSKAVQYLGLALGQAVSRSSLEMAADLAQRGLKLLGSLPANDSRFRAELSFYPPLIIALVGARGYAAPELEAVFNRALELCRQLGSARQLFEILNRRMYYHAWKAEWAENLRVGQRMLAIARKERSSQMMAESHVGLMDWACLTGRLVEATEHAAAVSELAASTTDQSDFDRVLWDGKARWCEAYLRWYAGYPDQSRKSALHAVNVLRSYGDTRQLAQLLNNCHPIFVFRGDVLEARRFAEEAISLGEHYGLRTQVAWATFNMGCTLMLEGKAQQAISQMISGMAAHEAAGNRIKTWMLGPLANAYRMGGRVQEGRDTAARALDLAKQSGELLWAAELHRLTGELLLLGGDETSDEAGQCFRTAIAVAKEQQAKGWELRATISLARLLSAHGEAKAARAALEEIFRWFSEGLDTADLKEAAALLGLLD